ncbi:cinnamoyl-coa reductase 1 [Phtheirospermum japonicum]|uniref:Dihydroflavonol 4-reductase n=1 Tax=Phtheirospermum japonicum TaxID=374723 RepID=A0A830DHG5_9LAMI|nr:cinnamoyl-coa reductase 1 [Phtheirospermum japonicum]
MSSTVCVTGAGGYVASWLIKLIISHGYKVHGTLRNLGDEKYVHLKSLKNAYSILTIVKGCDGIFHVASPVPSSSVPNLEVEVVAPALNETLKIIKACSQDKTRRVVVVSSGAALVMNPNRPKDRVIDETCWSDREYCRTTNNWFCYLKTVAEVEALEYVKQNELDVVTVCPTLVLGPMLQHAPNASSLFLIKLLREGFEEVENKLRSIVDVRDVADAFKLVYEKREAKGRYICTAHTVKIQDLVQTLRQIYPSYNYPKSLKRETNSV